MMSDVLDIKTEARQTMKKDSKKGEIKVLEIDLAKQRLQLHSIDESGQSVLRKNLTRAKLAAFIARLPPCLIGLEACGRAYHRTRRHKQFSHRAKIMAPQFVKPHVKSNKHDAADTEAICEAVQRPSMRFGPKKSLGQ